MLLHAYGSRALNLRALLLSRQTRTLLCHAVGSRQQPRDVADASTLSRPSAPRSGRQQQPQQQQAAIKPPPREGSRGGAPRPSSSAPYRSQEPAPPPARQQQQRTSASPSTPSSPAPAASRTPRAPAAAAAAHGDEAGPVAVHEAVRESKARKQPTPSTSEDPTIIPRNPGIKDGPWREADDRIMKSAAHASYLFEQKKASKIIYGRDYVLLGKTAEELSGLAVHFKQPSYRGAQLYEALLKGARSVEDISNIPKDFKAQLLQAGVRTGRSIVHHSVSSPDGTRKFLLQLNDGRVLECVGIPLDPEEDSDLRKRLTVCVSSQVGCPMRCTFCATGKGGFARNLLPHEIIDQVLTVQEEFKERVSNVVFMGMGEPMLNIGPVVTACRALNVQLGIGARYLTISTVGVPNTLFKLSRAGLKATLAISIHAPTQELREQIVPSAKAYPLNALMDDIAAFYAYTKRRVTFEYTLLAGVNDQDEHATALAALLRSYDIEAHVNVIPWNPVDESEFQRPSRNRAYAFQRVLSEAGVEVSLRLTRGLEAAAACGQLRNQHQKVPLSSFTVPE